MGRTYRKGEAGRRHREAGYDLAPEEIAAARRRRDKAATDAAERSVYSPAEREAEKRRNPPHRGEK